MSRYNRRLGTRASLQFADWPLADRELFEAAFAPGDVFDRGPLAHLAASSRTKIGWCYGAWLAFVAKQHPGRLALSPSERAGRPTLVAYARHLAGEGYTRSTLDNYVKPISWLLAAAGDSTVKARIHGFARIGTVRRDDASAIVTSDRLIELGIALMDEAYGAPGSLDPDRAKAVRDGLIVALLAGVPVRRANFAELQLGVSLLLDPHRILVSLAPEYTKSRRRIEQEVPRVVESHVRRYLADVRPMLPGALGSTYLWPSDRKPHLTADRIYNIVARLTKAAFGQALSPHDFRDAAATTIALHRPEKIVLARDLLSHADLSTTEEHYIRARGVETSRAVEEIVETARRPPEVPGGG